MKNNKVWAEGYTIPIEDPLDATNNAAKAISKATAAAIQQEFLEAFYILSDVSSPEGAC